MADTVSQQRRINILGAELGLSCGEKARMAFSPSSTLLDPSLFRLFASEKEADWNKNLFLRRDPDKRFRLPRKFRKHC